MKQKLLFIRMAWKAVNNKENGWIFFKMSQQQQLDFLNNTNDVNINFRYVGMDSRVISKLVDRLKNSQKN
jgi:hypothetical protein